MITARREKLNFLQWHSIGYVDHTPEQATSPGVVGQLQLDLIGLEGKGRKVGGK